MTALEVNYTPDELATLVAAAERRGLTVSAFVQQASLGVAARKMTKAEREAAIVELGDLNWSAREISMRLGIDRETVTRVLSRRQVTA